MSDNKLLLKNLKNEFIDKTFNNIRTINRIIIYYLLTCDI